MEQAEVMVHVEKRLNRRLMSNKIGRFVFLLATLFGLFVLALLLYRVVSEGWSYINWNFLTGKLSTDPNRAGIFGAILGTLWLMAVVAPVTMILGVATAIYLEMYARPNKLTELIQTNIANLAGVPSIVYGILGLTVFVRLMDLGNVVLALSLIHI